MEYNLAKVGVAGSNPVSRSFLYEGGCSMSCPLSYKPSPAGYSKVRSLVGPAADSVGAAAAQRVPPAHRAVSRFFMIEG